MVSKLSIYSSKFKKSLGEQGSDSMASLTHKFTQMKHQIQSERYVAVGEKLEKNSKRIQTFVSDLETLAASRKDASTISSNDSDNFLSLRMDSPLCKVSGLVQGFADRDDFDSEEVVFSSTAKLPHTEKIPPYTTWIFLERNQRMADDQSVLGRRRIYYDQHDSEALICSDSEEELGALEGEKYGFSEGEDRILRVALQECEVSDECLDTLTKFVGGTIPEIQERCNMLREKDPMIEKQNLKSSGDEGSEYNVLLDKSLDAALDSFDNLFCRRCLVFDCRMHGCSQNLIHPSEKQTYPNDPEEDRKPCGNQCYLQLNDLKDMPKSSDLDPMGGFQSKAYREGKSVFSSYAAEPESEGKHTPLQLVSDDLLSSSSKKLKLAVSDTLDHGSTLGGQVTGVGGSYEYGLQMSTSGSMQVLHIQDSDMLYCAPEATGNKISDDVGDKGKGINEYPSKQACDPFIKLSNGWNQWKPFEKDLYLKGLEIFGRNSCYIARNLLSGLKTCKEVSRYMYGAGAILPRGSSSMGSSLFEDCGKADLDNMEPEMPVKSRICRKRGRARKVKSSWKSAGHPSLWRRIVDGKDQPFKQYVPCVCESSCGKQCSCLQSGTCCEKYCGCSKSCKNRFRGCHCAKSQCKSRQCPCFAAGRECDPDVCRNCWVSCGDGSLGEPPRRGDGQCGNMKLLLRQQQRILLTKSDVAGWGAFLKNSVNKNDYLGEYTGELISHREADKRGKIYDRANSSFLFDLNDQYVLDAYRKGDKLKFANHSSNPNCYAKVMLVAGDHRVGIYANERIEGGEELFYDYRYGPDQAPAWARKPEGSKRDGSPIFLGRAKKHQSG